MSWDKPMPARPVVAVAGATGAVGREMLLTLEQRAFPAAEVQRARELAFGGQEAAVRRRRAHRRGDDAGELRGRRYRAVLGGGSVSKELAPGGRRARLRRDRQLLGVPDGRGRPARGARGERRGRGVALGHHREPELLDDPDGRGAQAAARPRAHQARRRVDVSGGERRGCGSDERALRAERRLPRRSRAPRRPVRPPHRVQLHPAHRRVPRRPVHQRRVEDGRRDQEDHARARRSP